MNIIQRIKELCEESKPIDDLTMLKMAIRHAAKKIREESASTIARTAAHRLSLTLSFVRAIESGEYGLQNWRIFQCGRLDLRPFASQASTAR